MTIDHYSSLWSEITILLKLSRGYSQSEATKFENLLKKENLATQIYFVIKKLTPEKNTV